MTTGAFAMTRFRRPLGRCAVIIFLILAFLSPRAVYASPVPFAPPPEQDDFGFLEIWAVIVVITVGVNIVKGVVNEDFSCLGASGFTGNGLAGFNILSCVFDDINFEASINGMGGPPPAAGTAFAEVTMQNMMTFDRIDPLGSDADSMVSLDIGISIPTASLTFGPGETGSLGYEVDLQLPAVGLSFNRSDQLTTPGTFSTPPVGGDLDFVVPTSGVIMDFRANIQGQGSAVPEPATLSLLAFGGLLVTRRRR